MVSKLIMKKILYLSVLVIVLTACAEKPFEGKISYEVEFETGLGDRLKFIDNLLGQVVNSSADLYIKDSKVMIITEVNNTMFGSFQGSFNKLIYDLENQEAFTINDKDKTYIVESLLESDIEGFNFRNFKSQLDSAKFMLNDPSGQMKIADYQCNTYETDGMILSGKIALSSVLLQEIQPTLAKIEGMQDYDLTGLGFPLYFETKLFGKAGMTVQASRIEHKVLDEAIFSIDGYRKIDKIEFYQQNLGNIDLSAFGLDDEMEELQAKVDSLSSGIVGGIAEVADSIFKDIDAESIIDQINNIFRSDDDEN